MKSSGNGDLAEYKGRWFPKSRGTGHLYVDIVGNGHPPGFEAHVTYGKGWKNRFYSIFTPQKLERDYVREKEYIVKRLLAKIDESEGAKI